MVNPLLRVVFFVTLAVCRLALKQHGYPSLRGGKTRTVVAALSIVQPRRWYAPVPPMDHDPLGRAGVAENADAEPVEHAGVDTCEQEGTLPAADTAPILAKGTVGVVLSGETESAAAAMHDALGPKAHEKAGRRPEALP